MGIWDSEIIPEFSRIGSKDFAKTSRKFLNCGTH
jgi:hypothetical protein